MTRVLMAVWFCLATLAHAAEDQNDSYDFRTRCPEEGAIAAANFAINAYYLDGRNFPICQCTSYVAHKLNERWGNTNPRFTNQYYGFTAWSDAGKWLNRALSSQAEIGVTGARDNFTWDEGAYNAVFQGDVALWSAYGTGGLKYGHVAYVEAAGQDAPGKGVAWVTVSEYNFVNPGYVYSRRTLYKGNSNFPDYFLHIDQDRIYCLAHPSVDTCPSLIAGKQVASGPGSKVGGLGGSSDPFNLIVNQFWVRDLITGTDLVSDQSTVRTGQALEPRIQVKARDGDTHDHMRAGKDTIEIDLFVREDFGDWRFLQREYIQATNLPSGATHTEHGDYTVPPGVNEVSFKAKVDAEDEAEEANEGDNWTEIQTFTINNTPSVDFIVTFIEPTHTPLHVGGLMGARMAIRNIGSTLPSVSIRSTYAYRPLGTNGPWIPLADDGSDPTDFVPGRDQWEEILSLVPTPTTSGDFELLGCADTGNNVTEPHEDNNCFLTTFRVEPPLPPNFIVSALGLREGNSIKSGTRVHPWCTVKNIGGPSPISIELQYFINWNVYRDNDTVAASELCAGCAKTEEVLNNNIKLGDKGSRTYRCCVDTQGAVAESNEGDNCATISILVR